jgi:hypothetical protein
VFLSVLAAPLMAAPQDKYFVPQGVNLWGDLKTGMSKEEVEEKYPDKRFELVSDCRVKIAPWYKSDKLFSVSIRAQWTGSYNECGEIVQRSLTAKYGDLVDVNVAAGKDALGAVYDTYQWRTDTLVVELARKDSEFVYVKYEPRLIVEEADLIETL